MPATYWIVWVVGYLIGLGIFALVVFWVVRSAILSALAEDRHRTSAYQRTNPSLGAGDRNWLEMEESRRAERQGLTDEPIPDAREREQWRRLDERGL